MANKIAESDKDIKSLARGHTANCVRVLSGIMNQKKASYSARVAAAVALLDRGWGRPAQAVAVLVDDRRDSAEITQFIRALLPESDGDDAKPIN